MAGEVEKERTLEETATWSVAVVCFVLVVISILLEHLLHIIGKWLKNKHKRSLYEAVEKIKAELMLLGFISLLLTVLQTSISNICVPRSVAMTWRPCRTYSSYSSSGNGDDDSDSSRRKLLEFVQDVGYNARRELATKGEDKCTRKGKVAFVTAYGIHQLHIFIFVLAISHIIYCIVTLALGRFKMRKWKAWEEETKTLEYQYYNDPERFRFARDTSFGRRHLNYWSKSTVSLWIVCFFRQFFGSVTKVDYMTLRHGFIAAHLAPGSETKFDFQKYIKRSLEEDFKVVVGITPIIWFIAVLFLLTNTNGWHSYYWIPFIPLIIVLMVGTKLQVIITKMGLRIQDRGDVVKGTPIVQPGDELFWFGRPRFILFLIHVVLFQNAFQLAFFAWSTYEFGIRNCFHQHWQDIAIRVSMGVMVQFACSYVTMPLYALVTQMGTTMRPTIFNDRVAAALKKWHHTAKKQTKHGTHSESTTPFSSMPPTPSRGMSPVHLLQNYPRSSEGYMMSPPRVDNFDNEERWYNESVHSPRRRQIDHDSVHDQIEMAEPERLNSADSDSTTRAHHEIDIHPADFSFSK